MSSLLLSANRSGLAGLAIALLMTGCEKGPRSSTASNGVEQQKRFDVRNIAVIDDQQVDELPQPIDAPAGSHVWISPDRLPWEAWYLQYLEGNPIGYSHVIVTKSSIDSDNNRILVQRTDSVETLSDGEKSRFERTIESLEYSHGHPIAFSDTTRSADHLTITEGKLNQNTLTLSTTTDGESKSSTVAWEAGTWGWVGIQAILMQCSPQPGERLEAKIFIPQVNRIASAKLVAGAPDITSLPGGKTESLLPIDVMMSIEESSMQSRNWINVRGEIVKTHSFGGPNLSTFRVPAEVAQRIRDRFELDDLLGQSVPLTGYTARPAMRRVVYKVDQNPAAATLDIFSLIAASDRQSVKSTSALSAVVTVVDDARDQPMPSDRTPPTDACRRASVLVPWVNPVVKELAQLLSPDALTPSEIALQLTQGVQAKIQPRPFDSEVTDALQIARRLEGDCTECAVLLTALLRSRQIPARVASGLRVDPADSRRMLYHMWTEAWIDERWIPLDATEGNIAGVDRIKMLDSPLEGENPYMAVLPVFEAMDGLEITLQFSE